jgi:hypothetical protein
VVDCSRGGFGCTVSLHGKRNMQGHIESQSGCSALMRNTCENLGIHVAEYTLIGVADTDSDSEQSWSA